MPKQQTYTKAFKNKFDSDYPRLIDYLKLTNRYVNESLILVMRYYKAMSKAEQSFLRNRFDKRSCEEFKAIYYDIMGLPFQSKKYSDIKTTPKLCNEHKDSFDIKAIKKCAKCKNKRQGRSQSAHAWMEPITDINPSRPWGTGKDGGNLSPDIKKIILSRRAKALKNKACVLFDRKTIFAYNGDDIGFPRAIFDIAARRMLNFEQNQLTHEKIYNDTLKEFEEWKESERYPEFEKNALKVFQQYEKVRSDEALKNTEKRIGGKTTKNAKRQKEILITGAMAKGWNDIKENLAALPINSSKEERIKIIDEYQRNAKFDVGDVNFLKWLAQNKNLWEYVSLILKYNQFQIKLAKYQKPINFTYPHFKNSPEWTEFSRSSPGAMYDICSLKPFSQEVCIFIPKDDYDFLSSRETKSINPAALPKEKQDFLKKPLTDFSSLTKNPLDCPEEIRKMAEDSDGWLDPAKLFRIRVKFNMTPDKRLIKKMTKFKFTKRGPEPDGKINISLYPKNIKEIPADFRFGTQRLVLMKNNAYLYSPLKFAIDDIEKSLGFEKRKTKIDKNENQSQETLSKKAMKKKTALPDKFRIVSVDLGQRFAACAVVLENGNPKIPVAYKYIKLPGIELKSIDKHLSDHKNKMKLSALIQKKWAGEHRTTTMQKGAEFDRELMAHISNMKEDRAKKFANLLIRFAIDNKAEAIIFENLMGYKPDQERAHRVNKNLMIWNRRSTVDWVDKIGSPFGYARNFYTVRDKVSAAYTSRMCHKCGSYGVRFSKVSDDLFKKELPANDEIYNTAIKDFPELKNYLRQLRHEKIYGLNKRKYAAFVKDAYQVIRGGKLFCCRECGKICNADYNAAINLGKRFLYYPGFAYEDFIANIQIKYNIDFNNKNEKKIFFKESENEVQKILNKKLNTDENIPPINGWNKIPTGKKTDIIDPNELPF